MTGLIRKPWGHEYCAYRNEHVAIWVLHITKGERTSLHAHPNKNTALIILRGTVELEFIRGRHRVMTGLDKINIFRGRFHRTRAVTDAVLLEVEAPGDKGDIVRLDDDYGRAALPLETGTEPIDEHCLRISESGCHHDFAACGLMVSRPSNGFDLPLNFGTTLIITLRGGLRGGLLPPGDAVDAISFIRMASKFSPIPGSQFLQIWKSE